MNTLLVTVASLVLGLAALLPGPALAQSGGLPAQLIEKVTQAVDQDAERLKTIFKDLHQHPELGFMETRTAGILAKELEGLGFDVQTGIGKTGVVGILRNGSGPIVMYRADMDANAVEEGTGLPYSSTVRVTRAGGDEVPVAHLCGHDAHVTWLLGVAKTLVALKSEWQGTLVLVGQPAEELILGAKAMVADGMYDKGVPEPDYLLGLHTAPISTGLVALKPGDFMTGTDQLDVTFHGIGGHGSSPHLTKDPVLMASAAVVQYQFIVSRGINPLNAAVVTVGSVQAGADNNVIPASALLKINLRWYDETDRQRMLDSIERINQSLASAYNLPADLKPTTVMKGGAKVLSNDADMAKTVQPGLRSLLGNKNVIIEAPPLMGSEDFHHLVIENEKHHYLYMFVGTAQPEHVKQARAQGKLFPYSNHNPDYQVDLEAIPLGAKIGTVSVLTFLNQ